MTEIKFDGDRLAADIAVHLNNARASLASNRLDLAMNGFVSAITAYALADEAMLFVDRQTGDYERLKALRSDAKAIGAAYRDSFGLAIHVGNGGKMEVVQEELPKPSKVVRHIEAGERPRKSKTMTKDQQVELMRTILAGPKPDETQADFIRELERAFGITEAAYFYYRKKAQTLAAPKSGNHK